MTKKTDLDNFTTFLIDTSVDFSLEKNLTNSGYLLSIEDIAEKTTNDPRIGKLSTRLNFTFDEEDELISILYRDPKRPWKPVHFYKKRDKE